VAINEDKMSEWTAEELQEGVVTARRMRAYSDTLADLALELGCQRNALLEALEELLYHTEKRGDANKLLAVGKAQQAIARTKGKP
jgi:hypothetical protein